MSRSWLPGDPVAPMYAVRNWGEPWARDHAQLFGKPNKAPNSGGGGGGKGGAALLGPPGTPTATPSGSTQLDLAWTDAATAEEGYKIERSLDGLTGWTQVGTNAANDGTFSDTGLTAETTYYYRVRAYNGSRNGGYSAVFSGTTGAAGPGSSPAGWWKADAGLFQTENGVAATASNDPVGEWEDQSGGTKHLLQATAGRRPLLQLNQINGLPCLRFDGSDDAIKALFTLNLPFQVFMVVKQITYTTSDILLCCGTGDTWSISQGGSSGDLAQFNGVSSATNSLAVSSWGIIEGNMPPAAGANQTIRVNQVAGVAGGANSAGDRGGITVGAHALNVQRSNIDVAEVILYDSVLSGAALTAVYSYLNGRYGL